MSYVSDNSGKLQETSIRESAETIKHMQIDKYNVE